MISHSPTMHHFPDTVSCQKLQIVPVLSHVFRATNWGDLIGISSTSMASKNLSPHASHHAAQFAWCCV